jgi:LEA14-like dessication related protein
MLRNGKHAVGRICQYVWPHCVPKIQVKRFTRYNKIQNISVLHIKNKEEVTILYYLAKDNVD